jgi:hypothetical protein
MQDPLSKADGYRKEAVKCYELAKSCSPGFLRDCYRRVAMQYLFMADGELKLAESQGNVISKQERLVTQGVMPCQTFEPRLTMSFQRSNWRNGWKVPPNSSDFLA